ncbi:hypothetical protein SEA_SCAP1_50 [Streptomyces phage Scap1]|uniref:Uncharacterized protein n=1 Tax=Streptomyces phage Scap1 TaxID=2041354 RepID=A0A2D1GNS2_9CAUD|nr:hypothetical protein FDI71_gp50 [Streptomyces phage Scap1]ATN93699.1 hypothetical protein SEA_SCAP1_50 [Streptomyces phage Scap1]
MSDTPIFDQLARELGYNRMVAGGPTLRLRPSAFQSKGQTDEVVNAAPNGYEPKIAYVDELQLGAKEDEVIVFQKPIPVTTLAELAKGQHQE